MKISWVTLIAIVLFTVLMTRLAHCDDNTKQCLLPEGCNALGVVISNENPNVYLVGDIVKGEVDEDTKVVIHPFRTPMLHTQELLLCGDQAEPFNNMDGMLVITYERRSHKQSGCHMLVEVDRVEVKNELQP